MHQKQPPAKVAFAGAPLAVFESAAEPVTGARSIAAKRLQASVRKIDMA
jgi:hypothetical protein